MIGNLKYPPGATPLDPNELNGLKHKHITTQGELDELEQANIQSGLLGVFGTTISPYLFFWQASEEVEDMKGRQRAAPLVRNARAAGPELRRIRWDTWSGMFYSNATAYFIILATAVTLNVAGLKDIETAAQAASALRPLAGDFAFMLFALGILGVGLIGVPVLAGSAAYALCEAMGWKWGLERTATDARGFYGVIAVSLLAGLVIQYSPISPMKALFWSAVINGVVAVPLMAVIILLVSKKLISALRAPCGERNGSVLDCARKGAAVTILVACNPVKKHGPWVVARLRVVTPSGDPV